jgi:hypothetical protein
VERDVGEEIIIALDQHRVPIGNGAQQAARLMKKSGNGSEARFTPIT